MNRIIIAAFALIFSQANAAAPRAPLPPAPYSSPTWAYTTTPASWGESPESLSSESMSSSDDALPCARTSPVMLDPRLERDRKRAARLQRFQDRLSSLVATGELSARIQQHFEFAIKVGIRVEILEQEFMAIKARDEDPHRTFQRFMTFYTHYCPALVKVKKHLGIFNAIAGLASMDAENLLLLETIVYKCIKKCVDGILVNEEMDISLIHKSLSTTFPRQYEFVMRT
jgi:hypothetical protein